MTESPVCSPLHLNVATAAAEIADVQAIHPGYGFLAENDHFAEVCRSCKIEFIGPPVKAMAAVGDKVECKKLAKKAKNVGLKRFVYFSSCSVYGASSTHASEENGATNPLTAYAKCKLLVERDLKPMADDKFCPTYLRNATAYGPSPRQRFDLVVNNLCGHAWCSKEIKMDSDGTPWRPFVHILDISQAAACTLEAPRDFGFGLSADDPFDFSTIF